MDGGGEELGAGGLGLRQLLPLDVDPAIAGVKRLVGRGEDVRRAERAAVTARRGPDSWVVPYLNRLSDLLWTLARWQEGESLTTRSVPEP